MITNGYNLGPFMGFAAHVVRRLEIPENLIGNFEYVMTAPETRRY